MKKVQLALSLLLTSVVFAQNESINAIIGDASFVQRFKQLPNNNSDEVLRIETHLKYVENLLRQKNTSDLPKKQKNKRAIVLDLLHQYWTNGIFPKNYDYPGRRPCFIDREGNVCAVGYLVEKTVGRKAAEQINSKHQYDYLLDMHEEAVDSWAKENGLTLEECAMIQPTYGQIPTDETFSVPIQSGYGISSGIIGGVNIGVNVLNISNRNFGPSKTFSYVALATGASQLMLGLTNIREDGKEYQTNGPSRTISYKSQNNLSYINIAAGTATMLTSAVNLVLNKRIKDKRNALNLYSYPSLNNKMVAGLAFTRCL